MAFFNFAENNLDKNITNPCDSPMLRKLFRPKVRTHSKLILRHSNLSTTQIYLGKISDSEALKWIETINV